MCISHSYSYCPASSAYHIKLRTYIRITTDIPLDLIHDQLIAAFEGGSTSWCREANPLNWEDESDLVWWGHLQFFQNEGFQFEIIYDDPNKPEGNGAGRQTINLEKLQKGVQILADNYPSHFADILLEEGDAYTGDALLQCVVLGDIVYG